MGNPRIIGKLFVSFVFALVLIPHLCRSELALEGREQVVLEGEIARISVDTAGGSIVDFRLIEQGLNPLNWNYPEKGDLKPRTMGHFICFDRWGQPSAQELKNGMPFHGEAAQVVWKVLLQPMKKDGTIKAVMSCKLPIGGMTVKRTLNLYENAPVLMVREEFTNVNKLGRICNVVQHSTIAPPFLDKSVLVDSNAHKGFPRSSPMPTPEEPVVYWPKIVFNDKFIDLRRLIDDQNPNVASFVFPEGVKYGWVTACNPGKGLLIGYLWDVSDYPWINFWRYLEDGKPDARGLEFGTTGLHEPFGVLVAKGKIFGRSLYEYYDAGQTIVKTYTAFLSRIPANYKGVEDVHFQDGKIVIKEKGENGTKSIIEFTN